MKIIIDSNIIFSSLLKTHTTFGQIIFNSKGIFEFHSTQSMRIEIRKHWDKLKKISKLTDDQLEDSYYALLTEISFINEELIPQKLWEETENLLLDIDLDDIDFVALTKYLKGNLWTGDNELYIEPKEKGFKNILNTSELLDLWMKRIKK